MPKERLQTKWNPDTQNWEVFLSMKNNSLARRSVNLIAECQTRGAQNINSLEDIAEIRDFLENLDEYKTVQEQLDNNRYAVLTGKDQKPKAGFYLQATTALIGASSLANVLNSGVAIHYANEEDKLNRASFSGRYTQSIINLVVNTVVAISSMLLSYFHSHKTDHKIIDADKAHEFIDELLGRLDLIRDEVNLKNKVLEKVLLKINHILRLNIDPNESRNKNFINEIIAALDLNKDDNIETWKLFDRNITNLQVDNLEINDNDLSILKNKICDEYQDYKDNLRQGISTINNLPDLLNYIDIHMLTASQIRRYGEKILPKAFIALDIVQLLQGKHLIQRENAEANPPASSSSSSNNNPATSLAIFNQRTSNQNLPPNDSHPS